MSKKQITPPTVKKTVQKIAFKHTSKNISPTSQTLLKEVVSKNGFDPQSIQKFFQSKEQEVINIENWLKSNINIDTLTDVEKSLFQLYGIQYAISTYLAELLVYNGKSREELEKTIENVAQKYETVGKNFNDQLIFLADIYKTLVKASNSNIPRKQQSIRSGKLTGMF